MVNGLQADLVTIVGDLADGTASQLGPAARPLRGLESRYGTFFVTGNHEYLYDGVEDWLDEMRNVGVRPLVNERVEIRHNGAHLDLAGVEDLAGRTTAGGPTSGRPWGGGTCRVPSYSSPTSRCSPARPPGTGWTSNCPDTRTAGRCSR